MSACPPYIGYFGQMMDLSEVIEHLRSHQRLYIIGKPHGVGEKDTHGHMFMIINARKNP